MKKFRFLVLCLSLVALLVLGLVACTGDEGAASGTSTEPAKSDTASATERTPDADTETDTDGYPIAFRVAGIMGASWGGDHTFTNVTVQNINISGFHNLAGILGYDASGLISEYSFENCKVEGATMVFSYCLSPNYTTDMPRRFVSVFYNGPKWVDNIDACVEQGNTFSGVSFYDWTSTEEVDEYGNKKVSAMTEFSPDNFRSWTQEEADA